MHPHLPTSDRLAVGSLGTLATPPSVRPVIHAHKVLSRLRASASGNGNKSGEAELSRHISTQLLHGQYTSSAPDPFGASAPPLYQTSTFAQPDAVSFGPYDYTRSGNPTRTLLEEQMAAVEGADRAFAFTSGMAALAVVCQLVGPGKHIVAGDDIYGGTSRLLADVVTKAGISVTNVDMTDLDAVKAAIKPGHTELVMVESPTNPRMQICDVAAIAKLARAGGAVTCVDNSIMAPAFQRPLDLGAEICMTSGTKFLGGHADIMCGILSVRGKELGNRVYFLQNACGSALAPFDCWLTLRGLKTMSLRMERSAANCAALARYLASHPLVRKVNYAGLPDHPGHNLHFRQATSGGSLLSFETGNLEASRIIVETTKLFKITVSFGNVATLISLPCFMSHASIPADVRKARGLPDDLVRISAGIEDIDDLLADLDEAMSAAMRHVGLEPPPPYCRSKRAAAVLPAGGTSHQDNGTGAAGPSAEKHDGAAADVPPASERELQLLRRIAELEGQLAAASRQAKPA